MSDEKHRKSQTLDGQSPPSYAVSTEDGAAGRDDILPLGSVDPVYQAKAELLNAAIQEMGMGKYQVGVFIFKAPSGTD